MWLSGEKAQWVAINNIARHKCANLEIAMCLCKNKFEVRSFVAFYPFTSYETFNAAVHMRTKQITIVQDLVV